MRPRHPRAAESGVGKHTARKSERVQACAAGKERVTNAHPHKLAPEAAKLPEPFSFSGPTDCPRMDANGTRIVGGNSRSRHQPRKQDTNASTLPALNLILGLLTPDEPTVSFRPNPNELILGFAWIRGQPNLATRPAVQSSFCTRRFRNATSLPKSSAFFVECTCKPKNPRLTRTSSSRSI